MSPALFLFQYKKSTKTRPVDQHVNARAGSATPLTRARARPARVRSEATDELRSDSSPKKRRIRLMIARTLAQAEAWTASEQRFSLPTA